MSRFIDRLKRLSRAESQPIGFRSAQPASSRLKIQLVASAAQEHLDRLADFVAGADAGVLRISEPGSGAEAIRQASQSIPDIPWGGWLQGDSPGKVKQMIECGCDFVIFPAVTTPLGALHKGDELGRILEVEASLSEGLLRAANELPVDAVLIAGEQKKDYAFTWQNLMIFRRFAALLTKPLLVSLPSKVTADELQALWEAGVHGVVAEAGVGQPRGKLEELRKVIDKLAFPSPHQPEKMEPLLPRTGVVAGTVTSDEEEEE